MLQAPSSAPHLAPICKNLPRGLWLADGLHNINIGDRQV